MNTHLTIQQLRKELEAKNAALQQEIAKRKQIEETLQQAYKELEQQVAERTAAFVHANASLQTEIAERKQIEETLKASETRYRELFTHMSSGVAVYETVKNGQDFIFKDFNQAGERIENIRKDDLIGKSVLEMFPGVKDFGLFEVFQRVWQTGEPEQHPISLYQDERLISWRENYVYKLPSGEIVAVYDDVTERKRAEEQIRTLNAELEQRVQQRTAQLQQQTVELARARDAADTANKAKSRFLANMSHELRTPLNIILGFTQLLERDPEKTPKQAEHLQTISRSGAQLLDLINDILEISRIEVGQPTLTTTSFDLYHTLDSVEQMFRIRADKKGLQLIFEQTPGIPQYIKTDQRKLCQILINLLGNAVKFTEDGKVSLRVCELNELNELEESGELGTQKLKNSKTQKLQFSIEDTGPGIAPEEMDTLFDVFSQTESGRKAEKGTGLGLALSRQFVQLMGGDIIVESQVGQGTIFTFTIQVELAEASEIQPQQKQEKGVDLQEQGTIPYNTIRQHLPSQLAALPPDIVTNLENAALQSDVVLINTLIDEIRDYDTTLADALARLAHEFDYDEVLRVVQKARSV